MIDYREECPQCSGGGSAYIVRGKVMILTHCPLCKGTGYAKSSAVNKWLTADLNFRLEKFREKNGNRQEGQESD